MRQNSARAVFLITDNSHIGPAGTSPMPVVEKLKKLNVPVFVIAIGTAVSHSEVAKITGSKDNVFAVKDLASSSLEDFARKVVAKTCLQISKLNFMFKD